MIRQTFLWGTILLASGAPAAVSTQLRSIELSTSGSATSVTLSLSGAVPQRVFTLTAPARVVVDLRHTRLQRGVRPPQGGGIVTGIRTGPRGDGTLRIVIEVNFAVSAHSHWLTAARGSPPQLVIDLGTSARTGIASATPAPAAPPQALPSHASAAPVMPASSAAVPAVQPPPAPAPSVRAAHAPLDTDRPIIIAVDAGHGGDDPGAIGHGGTREKDVTLAIARALAQRIDAEPGMRAVLTRDRDEFIMLPERGRRAVAANADLFVSVHADSIRDESIAGASVYVLSERGATSEAAKWLADRENSADRLGGVPLDAKNPQLDSVLIDLSQTATISNSMIAAQRVLTALDSVGEVRKPRVQQAGFLVLKSRAMPSMLVETAYISNPQEERRLRTSAQQDKLAHAIFSGIRTFFEANPPAGTRLAQLRRGLARIAPASPSLP
jgi:N-acetylmuramoyl-L-alanine amidase